MYNPFYIFVEGDFDELFLERILPEIRDITTINDIRIIKYQQKKNIKVTKHIKGIKKRNQNYLFLSDLDSHRFPCYTLKKEKIIKSYGVEENKIVIVKEEIESWYYSGLKDKSLIKNGLNYYCSKEEFKKAISKDYDLNFMQNLLKLFDLNLCIKNNESFKYFINKLKELIDKNFN
ncbi:MAG: hypothetical protein LBM96_00610 [Methanobrevibacter sp.]|nr:hypothetical protein [Candidatus Methanoflexus mossambicus]